MIFKRGKKSQKMRQTFCWHELTWAHPHAPPTAPLGPSYSFFFFLLVIFFLKMGVFYGQFPGPIPAAHPPPGQQIIQQTFRGKKKFFICWLPPSIAEQGRGSTRGYGTGALLGLRLNLEESFGRAFSPVTRRRGGC